MKFYFVFMSILYLLNGVFGMFYRRDSNNVLIPDLLPVSSTVVPLPYYSVYGYEKKLLKDWYKKLPEGKISLVTITPK